MPWHTVPCHAIHHAICRAEVRPASKRVGPLRSVPRSRGPRWPSPALPRECALPSRVLVVPGCSGRALNRRSQPLHSSSARRCFFGAISTALFRRRDCSHDPPESESTSFLIVCLLLPVALLETWAAAKVRVEIPARERAGTKLLRARRQQRAN